MKSKVENLVIDQSEIKENIKTIKSKIMDDMKMKLLFCGIFVRNEYSPSLVVVLKRLNEEIQKYKKNPDEILSYYQKRVIELLSELQNKDIKITTSSQNIRDIIYDHDGKISEISLLAVDTKLEQLVFIFEFLDEVIYSINISEKTKLIA